MREFWDKFLQIWRAFVQVFLRPPTWVKVLTYLLAVFGSVGSLLILLVDFTGTIWEIFAYALFGIAALSLGYAVYLTIPLIPRIKKWVIAKGESYNFTHSLMRNYSFRTIVFAFFSFLMSIAFGVLNGNTNAGIACVIATLTVFKFNIGYDEDGGKHILCRFKEVKHLALSKDGNLTLK
jgi:hypothetical protein